MLSLPGSTIPPKRGDTKGNSPNAVSTASTSNATTTTTTTRPPRITVPKASSSSSTSTSSVFIPRTSRTSTGFKKPVTQMNTTELQSLIERNESVLNNESVYSKLKDHQKLKLEEDLEVAHRRMERWIGWQQRGTVSMTPVGDDEQIDMISQRRFENGADVKRRLFNEQVVPSHTTSTSTQLLSNTESISIQTRLYNEAQEEIQQKKVLRGLESMTGLGRRLGEVGRVTQDEEEQRDDDEDIGDDDVSQRYVDGDDGESGDDVG